MVTSLIPGSWYLHRGRRLQYLGLGSEHYDNPCFDYYRFENEQGESVDLTHTDISKVTPAGETFWDRVARWILGS